MWREGEGARDEIKKGRVARARSEWVAWCVAFIVAGLIDGDPSKWVGQHWDGWMDKQRSIDYWWPNTGLDRRPSYSIVTSGRGGWWPNPSGQSPLTPPPPQVHSHALMSRRVGLAATSKLEHPMISPDDTHTGRPLLLFFILHGTSLVFFTQTLIHIQGPPGRHMSAVKSTADVEIKYTQLRSTICGRAWHPVATIIKLSQTPRLLITSRVPPLAFD
jgi:hypothetical protein